MIRAEVSPASLHLAARDRSVAQRVSGVAYWPDFTASQRTMPLTPNSVNVLRLLYLFDIFAVVVFAVSGALVASRKRLDVMGFMWLGVVTGLHCPESRDRIGLVTACFPGVVTAGDRRGADIARGAQRLPG